VAALALDASGDLYLVYHVLASASNGNEEQANVIHRFNPNGEQMAEFPVNPRQAKTTVGINGLALDASDRLAVIGNELGVGSVTRFGSVYEASTGRHIAGFVGPGDNDGISFNGNGDLYIAATDDQEVVGYVPAPLAELVMSPVPCEIGPTPDSAAAFDCALLAS
jgi:sugar lactone lactonase YvrE